MNDQELITACAELDGWVKLPEPPDNAPYQCDREYWCDAQLPNYLTSCDAITHAIVRWCGDDDKRWECFLNHLGYTRKNGYYLSIIDIIKLYTKSTTKQLAIAWVKSGGLWKE
jgi:hypothetical protein